MALALVHLGARAAGGTSDPKDARAQDEVAASWDRLFRRLGSVPLHDAKTFPVYCVERLLSEGRLKSGAKALVLAMGDGRNAVPFAIDGLDVTGVDISSVALEKAEKVATEKGVKIQTVKADLFKYDLGRDQWDLVTNIYFNPAISIFASIKNAVRPGGFLLVEGYGADYRGNGPPPWSRYKANQLIEGLKGWRILEYQDGIFESDWANGQAIPVVRVLAQKPAKSE
jgi:SAM-dependent methyltransferase